MGKVIYLKFPKKTDTEVIKLCHLADDIDSVVKHYLLEENIEVKDLIAVISHRLGTLLNKVECKDELWKICEEVLKKQASFKK